MNLKECYTTLELKENATPEEAKKKYRELSKKWHPDVNKAIDAEEKFKKINEAYQCIKDGKDKPRAKYGDPFGGSQYVELENIELQITISFKESVLGCKKDVKYSRKSKCQACHGNGEIKLNNGCKKCAGKGQITFNQHGMIFMTTCTECGGRSSVEDCKVCNTEGTVNADMSVSVGIPPGVINNNILRLQGIGHYAGSFMGFADQNTDVFCRINVTAEPGLTIDGKNVVSSISISLLEALMGCTKTINSIYGNREVTIPPKTRNNDNLIIPKLGVAGTGDQKVILDVQYPNDISKLIEVLSNKDV